MLLILGLVFFCNLSYPETRIYEATAYWQGETLYYERHRDLYEKGILQQSVIDFMDPEGKLIAFEEADYRADPLLPEYFFRDFRSGLTQGLKVKDKRPQMFSRTGANQKLKFKDLPATRSGAWLVWPALVAYLGRELESLIKERKREFYWIIPGRLEAYRFKIELVSYSSQLIKLELKLPQWALTLFSSKTEMIFDRLNKRLVYYEGPSRLRNSEGEMVTVEVKYYYSH